MLFPNVLLFICVVLVMSQLKVPILACVLGEGGSGGAIAFAFRTYYVLYAIP
jgi:acetyl-CoA carboxylase alpha subunit